MLEAYVYLLRCSDGSYYAGSARGGLEQRVAEHKSGVFGGYTAARRPVELAWAAPFQRITEAIAFERQIKGWTRAKKEALIRGDYDSHPGLSRKRFASFDTPRTMSGATQDEEERGLAPRDS
jgi:putative endonuclease